MTFPLGTMALSNSQLHRVFNHLKAFRVVGTAYAVALIIIVLVCLAGCVYSAAKDICYVIRGEKKQSNDISTKV